MTRETHGQRRNIIKDVGDLFIAGSLGAMLGLVVYGVDAVSVDEGRGGEITPCPTDFESVVIVNDVTALGELADVANDLGIADPDSHNGFRTDEATSPGELACHAVMNYGTGETEMVLLLEGLEALDRGTSYALIPGQSPLPDGLAWR